jgi:hypothetical protein
MTWGHPGIEKLPVRNWLNHGHYISGNWEGGGGEAEPTVHTVQEIHIVIQPGRLMA